MKFDEEPYRKLLSQALLIRPEYLLRFVDTREASYITGVPIKSLSTMRSRGGDGPPFVAPGERRIRYLVLHLLIWEVSGGFFLSTESEAPTFDITELLERITPPSNDP